jgi:lysophospholipase L1-like esterase
MKQAVKSLLTPLLLAQVERTRERMPRLGEPAGPRQGELVVDDEPAASLRPPLRVLIVGDSSAAGVGVAHQEQALAGWLARSLARRARSRVRWQLVARSGATTSQTLELLRSEPPQRADVAIVAVGINDMIEQVPTHEALGHREQLVDWLAAHAGVRAVFFAGLPPVHQFPAVPVPLAWVTGWQARALDRAVQRWVASREHGVPVLHVPLRMRLSRRNMAVDGFHPAEPAYRECAELLAEQVARLWLKPSGSPSASRRR